MSECELVLPRAGRGHGELDAPHADAHQGTELQYLEPDGAAGRLGELRVRQSDAAQSAEKYIGHGREPQSELVGAHRGRRRAVGEQIELAFLDAVLHLATGAVDHLVEVLRGNLARLERGDDEARVGITAGDLGFTDDAAVAAPAVQRRPSEV